MKTMFVLAFLVSASAIAAKSCSSKLPAGAFSVTELTHNHGPASTGKYAHFDIAQVDKIVGSSSWHDAKFKLKNLRTGKIGEAVLWRSHNRPGGR
jgi:hypothetical protein